MLNISYAQNFEDLLINRLFKNQQQGTYIDVGAAHPTKDSVTKYFYDRGWSGVNIEPNSNFHKLLEKDRTRDINLNCAVYKHGGEITFTYIPSDPKISFVGEEPQAEGASAYEGLAREVHKLNAMTLTEIYQKYLAGQKIDFVKIDVEGAEVPVLEGADLALINPRLLIIEAVAVKGQQPVNPERDTILASKGYEKVYFDGFNCYYAKSDDQQAKEAFAVPLNATDDPLHYRKTQFSFLMKILGEKLTRR